MKRSGLRVFELIVAGDRKAVGVGDMYIQILNMASAGCKSIVMAGGKCDIVGFRVANRAFLLHYRGKALIIGIIDESIERALRRAIALGIVIGTASVPGMAIGVSVHADMVLEIGVRIASVAI